MYQQTHVDRQSGRGSDDAVHAGRDAGDLVQGGDEPPLAGPGRDDAGEERSGSALR